MIEWRRAGQPNCGLFCVWKKAKEGVRKQRLIVDCRLANECFGKPNKVHLATGQSLGSIEVDGGDIPVPVQLGQVDIKDAFYNILLPTSLRETFCLPAVAAGRVGLVEVEGTKVSYDALVYPVFRCVPMGWTHALWFCQIAHERAALVAHPEVTSETKVSDRRVAPRLENRGIAHTEYVDNFGVFSLDKGKAKEVLEAVDDELQRRGWPLHPQELTEGGEILGWSFDHDAPTMRVAPARAWKLRLGIEALLARGAASGDEIRAVIGSCTFAGLVRRESLSIFSSVYVYMNRLGERRGRLWPAVRRELRWFCALVPLLCRQLDAPWSEEVYVTDASLWGRGVCIGTREPSMVAQAGRVSERWRFKRDEEAELALGGQLGEQGLDVAPGEVLGGGGYEAVGESLIGGEWKTVSAGKWGRSETMPILEGRSLTWALRHRLRSSRSFGVRCLFLTDSMTQALALSKGRSSNPTMNGMCRLWGALCLATNTLASVRWIPGEVNPADEPSRVFQPVRAAEWKRRLASPGGPTGTIHSSASLKCEVDRQHVGAEELWRHAGDFW